MSGPRSRFCKERDSRPVHRVNSVQALEECLENKFLQEIKRFPCVCSATEWTKGHCEANDTNKENRMLSDAAIPVPIMTCKSFMFGERNSRIYGYTSSFRTAQVNCRSRGRSFALPCPAQASDRNILALSCQ